MAASTARDPGCVAGIALNLFVLMREIFGRNVKAPILTLHIIAHQFRTRGFLVVLRMLGVDTVFDETQRPLHVRVERRSLYELFALPFEAALAVLVTV